MNRKYVYSFMQRVTLSLNLQGIALAYTSATLGAAIVNCLPATTFFFAVLLRMEKVNITTGSGIAKIGSVLVCMSGVATLAFYKGPQLRTSHNFESGHHNNQGHEDHFSSGSKRWILGCSLSFLAILIWSIWLVIQVVCI
ncbi:unnamed protein product [Lupinus luteus]|uniref:WAT1-related protein n=1 Tax=Lupinus luteus TaxID=3873 RepID=A0AAV1XD72_LUPLU